MNYPVESDKSYSLDFLGSCNGLICLKIKSYNTIKSRKVYCYNYSILNPLTREYKEFRRPDRSCDDVAYGFGYDGKIDDYKLVILSGYGCFKIDIYTLRSDSWTSFQCAVNYKFTTGKETPGVLFNGALHWSGRISSQVIVCFDISNETMVDMQFPENSMLPKDLWWGISADVGVWGDCICVALIWGLDRIEVWVMQQYGVTESWIEKYTTTTMRRPSPFFLNPCWKPLWCFDNGEFLVNYFCKELHLYDPVTKKVRSVVVCDITMDDNRESYVESIVSLNSGKYMEKQITDGKG